MAAILKRKSAHGRPLAPQRVEMYQQLMHRTDVLATPENVSRFLCIPYKNEIFLTAIAVMEPCHTCFKQSPHKRKLWPCVQWRRKPEEAPEAHLISRAAGSMGATCQ